MAKIQTPQAVRGTQDMFGETEERCAHVVATFERLSTSPAGRQNSWIGRLPALAAGAAVADIPMKGAADATACVGASGVTITAAVNTIAAATNTFVKRRFA